MYAFEQLAGDIALRGEIDSGGNFARWRMNATNRAERAYSPLIIARWLSNRRREALRKHRASVQVKLSMPKAFSSGPLRVIELKQAQSGGPHEVFLFCALIFVSSFVAFWGFWFVEKLRGDSAPQVVDLTAHRRR